MSIKREEKVKEIIQKKMIGNYLQTNIKRVKKERYYDKRTIIKI